MSQTISKDPHRILTGNFLLACLVNFACFSSFYYLLATLPIYVIEVGGTESQVGFVIGVMAVTALVFRPLLGRASDTMGRKPLIVAGAAMMAASAALYVLAGSFLSLLLIRVLQGAGFATFSTALMALVADIAPAHRRGEAMGWYGASTNLAMVAGPAVGVLILQSFGFRVLFLSSAGAALVALLASLLISSPALEPRQPNIPSPGLVERSALFPATVIGFNMIAYASIVSFLPLFATQQQFSNPGLFFSVLGLVTLVTRVPLGKLSDRYGRGAVVAPGLIVAGLGLVVLSRAASLPSFLAVSFLYGLGFAAIAPTLMALAIDRASPEKRGAAMGTFAAAMDLGIGGGAFMWGFVAQAWGYAWMYIAAASATLGGLAVFLSGCRPASLFNWKGKCDAG